MKLSKVMDALCIAESSEKHNVALTKKERKRIGKVFSAIGKKHHWFCLCAICRKALSIQISTEVKIK